MKEEILIIDDDEKLNELIKDYLKQFGYKTSSFSDPINGLKFLKRIKPSVVILDIMLPEMDGFEVLREIRKDSFVPVIMLTARGEVSDRIVGLELGADDYMAKPFEPRELVARIQSILRRTHNLTVKNSIYKIQNLKLNPNDQSASLSDKDIILSTLEFTALELLAKNPGRIFSRDDIMDSTRGIEWDSYDRSIDVLLSRLRTKLGDNARSPRYIKTVRGRGYMFIKGE